MTKEYVGRTIAARRWRHPRTAQPRRRCTICGTPSGYLLVLRGEPEGLARYLVTDIEYPVLAIASLFRLMRINSADETATVFLRVCEDCSSELGPTAHGAHRLEVSE